MDLSDYLEYFDIDFDDFDDFEDFWEFMMSNPPQNYDQFRRSTKQAVERQAENRFDSGISPKHKRVVETKKVFTKANKNFPKSKRETFYRIYEKRENNQKLTKTEVNNVRSAVFIRARQIQNNSNLNRSQSMKLAWREFK